MGKFGINERHSSLELNWHLPVADEEALELKRFLVRELDQQDISTHGLTFTIKTNLDIFYFTSIVIERAKSELSDDTFNILYAKNFTPTTAVYLTYAKGVRREIIPALLIELSKLYFKQLNPERESVQSERSVTFPESTLGVYQCVNCLTIYDERMGEPLSNIAAETKFASLPANYCCHVCGSPKNDFVKIQ